MAKFTTDRARDWLKLDMAARLQSIRCHDFCPRYENG
jgi:hypothetical protein